MYIEINADQLPAFKSIAHNDTMDLKKRLRSLESRPNRYKVQSKLRSKSIVGDDIEGHLIRVSVFRYRENYVAWS